MPRPARKLALVAGPEPATLHRRRQRVVVRAPGSRAPLDEPGDRREHFPTLSGLGFRDESDTLPAPADDEERAAVSRVQSRVAPRIPPAARSLILPPRARPTTLLDDVDDNAARKYREEAERLLESGIFDDWGDTE